MSRWRPLVALAVIAACTTSSGAETTDRSVAAGSTTATEGATTTTEPEHPTTVEILDTLQGRPCPESEFICVTLEMPLDHSNPGDGHTIDVTFAVLPAAGESRGAFVTATGGPGSSGIAVADSYTSALDPAIPGSYDIVFFDQRGVAMSGGLTCPASAAVYYRTDVLTGLGLDEETLATAAATFAGDCVAEMGNPEELPHLGTDQVAADLDAFRETFGFDEFVIYGESYGTQVAQTYAGAYGDYLTRMILDGTVDLTLDGFAFFEQQAEAFGTSLQMTLDYCATDPLCVDDMGSEPDNAYDRLTAFLAEGPLFEDFPLPVGGFEERQFGLGDLEVVASAQMYSEDDRMLFLRALAAYTERDDLVPLLRLLYLDLGVDPLDEAVLEDPTWSDGIYYAVECLDYSYPGTTSEERAAAFFAAGAGVEVNRLGTIFYGDLPCAYWPTAADEATRPDPLVAAGIPTVVVGATADPATPYDQGVEVASRLEEGYLITKEGGPHVVFGRGNPCPDDSVTAFILSGAPPKEAECEGEVVGYYIPLLPATLDAFDSLEAMLDSIEFEIFYMPEYYWWDTETDTPVGCNLGGTITFSAGGDRDLYTMQDCAFMEGVSLTGEGAYNWDDDVFTLDVQNGSVECTYLYERVGASYDAEDNCPSDPFPD